MLVADVPGPGCSTFSRPSLVAVMHCTLHSSTMLCAVHQCIQWGRSRGATVLGAAMTMYTPYRVCNTGSMIAQYRRSMVPQYRAQCFSNLGSIVTLSPPQYRASMVLNMVRHDHGTSIFAQLYIELSFSVSIVFVLSFHWNPDPTSACMLCHSNERQCLDTFSSVSFDRIPPFTLISILKFVFDARNRRLRRRRFVTPVQLASD